jgi:hypothetical protein
MLQKYRENKAFAGELVSNRALIEETNKANENRTILTD